MIPNIIDELLPNKSMDSKRGFSRDSLTVHRFIRYVHISV